MYKNKFDIIECDICFQKYQVCGFVFHVLSCEKKNNCKSKRLVEFRKFSIKYRKESQKRRYNENRKSRIKNSTFHQNFNQSHFFKFHEGRDESPYEEQNLLRWEIKRFGIENLITD